jgi:protoheme IX farnesyltransferase
MKTDALALPADRARSADFLALAKPRLNFLVVLSAIGGYYLGSGEPVDLMALMCTLAGTALVAGAASAFNQVYERDLDGLMERTRLRPLPDGRLQPAEGKRFACTIGTLGLVILLAGANVLAALVASATLASYVLVYTPLKRKTPRATVVGAIPGALPPMIGWAAAQGNLAPGAWVLFGIVFLWQMPHFLAIAWIYRDQYERAGIPLLPVVEPDGRSTARQVLFYGAALLPVSLTPALIGLAGRAYLFGALVLGIAFLALAVRFALNRRISNARALFLGSIIYLPLIWGLLIATRLT